MPRAQRFPALAEGLLFLLALLSAMVALIAPLRTSFAGRVGSGWRGRRESATPDRHNRADN